MAKVVLSQNLKDENEVVLQMDVDGEPKAHIFLGAPELSGLITSLAGLRGQLADEVVRDLDPGSRLDAIYDPVWRTMKSDQGVVLALRHPGLGWVSFVLPPHEAGALSTSLADLAKPVAE